MRKILLAFCTSLILIGQICAGTIFWAKNSFWAEDSWAEDTSPSGVVTEIISKLKHNKDPAAILEYIYWEGVFTKLPELERQHLHATNPTELRDIMKLILTDPGEFVRRQFEGRTGGADNQDKMKAALALGMQAAREQSQRMREKISETEFEIGDAQVDGANAKVALTSTLDGKKKTTQIELEQVSGRWYLSSLGLVNNTANARASVHDESGHREIEQGDR